MNFLFALLVLILCTVTAPSYAMKRTPVCKQDLALIAEQNKKLKSHLKTWLHQYAAFEVKKIEIVGLKVTVHGLYPAEKTWPGRSPPRLIRFRKDEYELKLVPQTRR